MTNSIPISAMVKVMLASGASHETIVAAVEAAELHAHDYQPTGRGLVPSATKAARGTRLEEKWQPSESDVAYAVRRGMALQRVAHEVEKFKNYWTALSGARATKRDWHATWRNWVLSALENRYGNANNNRGGALCAPGHPKTGSDAILSGMGRLARRVVERRMPDGPGDGPASDDADHPLLLDFERGRT